MRRGLLKKLGLAAGTALLATTLNAQDIKIIPYREKEVTEDILYIGNNRFGIRPLVGFGLDLGYGGRPVQKLLNVPEEVRHVPIHPDDYYADEKNNGPIEPKDIKGAVVGVISPIIFGGLEFKLDKIYITAAVNATSPMGGNNNSESYERNYTNHPGTSERGYGAALTEYRTSISPFKTSQSLLIIPGLSAEILIPGIGQGSLIDKSGIVVGYGLRRYKFNLETGWDRFDHHKWNQRFPVEDIIENSVYLGFGGDEQYDSDKKYSTRFRGNTRIGVNFYNYKRLDQYQEMEVKTKGWSLFIMQTIGIQF